MATNRRKDHNFFSKVGVTDVTFTAAQRVKWNFTSVGIALVVESTVAGDAVQYSFDGVTVHGDMTPGFASAGIIFDNRYENNIWFRRVSAGSEVTVRVETWRHNA